MINEKCKVGEGETFAYGGAWRVEREALGVKRGALGVKRGERLAAELQGTIKRKKPKAKLQGGGGGGGNLRER